MVLELEKQGTKLYTVAPFVFFLYLLRRLENTSTEVSEQQALQNILESGIHSVTGNTISFSSGDEGRTAVEKGTKTVTGVSDSAAGKTVSKAVAGTAAKTAAKHVGIKVASLILAGAVGAGGTADEWGAARRANLAAGARGGCGRRAGWRMLLSAGAVRSKHKNKAAARQPCSYVYPSVSRRCFISIIL